MRGEELLPEEVSERETIRLLKDAEFYQIDELPQFLQAKSNQNEKDNTDIKKFSLRPSNLFVMEKDSITNQTHFSWRWITDTHGNNRRAVTLEGTLIFHILYNSDGAPVEANLRTIISPLDLRGVNGYSNDLDKFFAFAWR